MKPNDWHMNGCVDHAELNDEERRVLRELSTALETTPYEIPSRITEVMVGLYLSNGLAASNLELLRHHSITHVLNMAPIEIKTGEELYKEDGKTPIAYRGIEARDEHNYNIMQHWQEARQFIDDGMQRKGKVLIHCQAGINRSGAITLAYVSWKKRQPLVESAKAIKRRRYQLITNNNFRLSLVKFASHEGLLGKGPSKRVSSPSTLMSGNIPVDEFSNCAWAFGYRGKPGLLYMHASFAPVHQGHILALSSALNYVRDHMPNVLLAGAFFSPCHCEEASQRIDPDCDILLADRLAMLRLACTQASQTAELPVSVDTWECQQRTAPSVATSVRSFARRAAAAAIRRGLGPETPVIVWVVPPGIRWPKEEVDVDPNLVAISVTVDDGQEGERARLQQHLKGSVLEDRVHYLRCRGPTYSSEIVRKGRLPSEVEPVQKYIQERLLWYKMSAQESELASIVERAFEASGKGHEGVNGIHTGQTDLPMLKFRALTLLNGNALDCPLSNGGAAGTTSPEQKVVGQASKHCLAATLVRPNVWRCLYRAKAELSSICFDESTKDPNSPLTSPVRGSYLAGLGQLKGLAVARRLVVKVYDLPKEEDEIRVEEEVCRRLGRGTQDGGLEAAMTVPKVVGYVVEGGKGVLVEAEGSEAWSRMEGPLNEEQLTSVIKGVAKLHARYWGLDTRGEQIGLGALGGRDEEDCDEEMPGLVLFRPVWDVTEVNKVWCRLRAALSAGRSLVPEAAGTTEGSPGLAGSQVGPLSELNTGTQRTLKRLAGSQDLMRRLFGVELEQEEKDRPDFSDWSEAKSQGQVTFIHGKLSVDRLGWDEETQRRFITRDWEGAGLGSGLWDVAMLIATGVLEERRSEVEGKALLTYTQELRSLGVRDYEYAEAMADYLRAKMRLGVALIPILAESEEVEGKRRWQAAVLIRAIEDSVALLGDVWGTEGL